VPGFISKCVGMGRGGNGGRRRWTQLRQVGGDLGEESVDALFSDLEREEDGPKGLDGGVSLAIVLKADYRKTEGGGMHHIRGAVSAANCTAHPGGAAL